ncbi:unnamed protein product [Rhizophagus irregularis]|nr:unnamed protein product [Rhizophagus irregularis]CAB5297868.1 unnamed protein product [Rhizophagus irregularis]
MIQKFQRNATVQEELDWILHDVVALFFRFRLDETYLLDVILLYTVVSFRSAKIIFAQKVPRSVDTSRPFSFL